MEGVRTALLGIVEAAWPARVRSPGESPFFHFGPGSDKWFGIASSAVEQSTCAEHASRAWAAVSAEPGLAKFLDTGSYRSNAQDRLESSFRRQFLPRFIAHCFHHGGDAHSHDIASAAVDSLETAFKTKRTLGLVKVYLLNCDLREPPERAGLSWFERMTHRPHPEPLTAASDVVVRPIAPVEHRELFKLVRSERPFATPSFGERELERIKTVVDVRFGYDIEQHHLLADESFHRVAGVSDVIQLSTNRHVLPLVTTWEVVGYPFFGASATWYQKKLFEAEGEELDHAGFPGQLEAYERLEERQRLALHRYGLALERDEARDQVIDFWVGLEALYLPFQIERGIGATVSRRAAKWLATSDTERAELFARLEEAYRVRSRIVHGAPHDRFTVINAAEEVGDALRRSLLKVLENPAAFRPNQLD